MTDEKLEKEAGEYAKPFHDMTRYDYVEERTHVRQAYIAGFHAGQPKWHDLRKDPNDLPKDSKEVLIITSDNRKHTGFYDNGWFCQDSGGIVIAWCEIPTFKE